MYGSTWISDFRRYINFLYGTTIEFSLDCKKIGVSNQLLSWLDSDFPLLYRTALGLFFVLRWKPLFRFVIVTMTNQMRTRIEWNTKIRVRESRSGGKKDENQKKINFRLNGNWDVESWRVRLSDYDGQSMMWCKKIEKKESKRWVWKNLHENVVSIVD